MPSGCCRALGLNLAGKSTSGYDAKDSKGRRYEIKARRQTPTSKPTHFSAIRGLPKQRFDFLVVVVFDEDYAVVKAAQLSFSAAQALARYRQHVNGSIVHFRDIWSPSSKLLDITASLRAIQREVIPRVRSEPTGARRSN
jgi:hypothetical protein